MSAFKRAPSFISCVVRVLVVCVPFVIAAGIGALPANADTATTFSGPLQPGYSADPDIVYYGGYYYELFNRGVGNVITIRKAPSLGLLSNAWNTTVYTADINTGCCDIGFGGFLFHYSNHWYIYDNGDDGNINNSVQFVLQSSGDDPMGPYSYAGSFAGAGPHSSSYALSPFVANGQLYAFSTSNGEGTANNSIYIATMSSPTALSSSWTLISQPASSGWECANSRCIDEGGSVNIHNGTIYALFSAGGFESPDYCVGMLTASATANLTSASSWTKSSGCVFSRSDTTGVWGPGSMTWFKSPDGTEDWVAYHGKTKNAVDSSGTDRQITAERVTWDGSGQPVFGSPAGFSASVTLPSGDPGHTIGSGPITYVPGGLTDVSVGPDGTVVGVAPDNRVWEYTGTGSLPWTEITGKALTRVAVRSASDIWGLASDGSIWRYTGSWNQIAGGAIDISAGADGTVWATASSGGTWQWTGGTSSADWTANWTLVPGSAPGGASLLVQASGKSASDLWGVAGNGNIWHYDGSTWTQISGSLTWVSEGSDGTVYGANSYGDTWRYNGSGWTQGSGPLTQVAVGSATNIWGVDSHTNIWRTD